MKNTLTISLGLLGMILLFGAGALSAATLTVDTTADSGVGSLRQALIDATSNAAANDIVFAIPTTDPGYDADANRFTITLISQLPSIPLAPTTITNGQAQAVTVMGDNTFRIFTLVNSAVVVISNLTMSNGSSGGLSPRPEKAGRGSHAYSPSALIGDPSFGFGGGIYMGDSGVLTLNNCSILNSQATANGGGVYMRNSSTLHLNRSTIGNNLADSGGGIFINDSGTLNISASTFNTNQAALNGGAIVNSISGTVNALSSTFDGNSASGNGGGIYNLATINLTDNTITSNNSGTGGGVYNAATATLDNNLIAANTATAAGNDLSGTFAGSYNLVSNADGSVGVSAPPNVTGTTLSPVLARIGPLQNNGGPTRTRALLFNSPAIDKGNSPTLTVDQRGMARIFDNPTISNDTGNGADIGAFELQSAPTVANVSIRGRVVTSGGTDGRGISKAYLYLTAADGNVRMAVTNTFGYYQISDVPAGSTCMIVINHKRYRFQARVVNVFDNMTEINWMPLD
jgi:hypothetical protein